MTLQETLKEELKAAMKEKNEVKLTVVRGLISACTNELVALGRTPQSALTDEEVLKVISRAVKQRKDSIDQFTRGGRPELAESEAKELAILETYLPAQMSREEVVTFVQNKLASEPVEKAKIGMFVGSVMKELKGKVSGDVVKSVVEELIQ